MFDGYSSAILRADAIRYCLDLCPGRRSALIVSIKKILVSIAFCMAALGAWPRRGLSEPFWAVILYEFGGVYADLDFEALRPLSTLLDDPGMADVGVIMPQEPFAHSRASLLATPDPKPWLRV
jgi:hypothetical protein